MTKGMNDKMQPMHENWPVPDALCVFKTQKGNFFLGYYTGSDAFFVKAYGKPILVEIVAIVGYQYVWNDNGGFLFIKSDPVQNFELAQAAQISDSSLRSE